MSEFERELLSYSPEHFTLQIMGSRSEEAVRRFVDRELSAFNHGYFEARHEGNPWFVVVSGHFTSRAAANRALSDLPANIRNMEPWIRSMGDVQAAISAAHPGIAAQ
jgi:DamX protein